MKAKEKARELYLRFNDKIVITTPRIKDVIVKDCALVAVDEMLDFIYEEYGNKCPYWDNWEQVRKEINKL